ncbi:alpha/beta hydrolase family protein [Rubrivivax rivuli]|uniref:Acetylhydrolase n=1 Tax=Rubrivivax rivuli TaxID=1862385 RepID=A0A437RM84_9BURK|nr:acetylhydrolase [Rubrivivax rivuli]RVU47722.1 acetylhydrolase [Rubrivivax rivuli]
MKPTNASLLNRRRCLSLGAAAALAAFATPRGARAATDGAAPAAPEAETRRFQALDLDWTDTTRRRPVPVRLYLPEPVAGARVPLVVFSHGIGGSRRGYTWLGQHVARHGIASLHLQHVGSDRTLWGGSIFGLVGRLQNAAQDAEAVARVQDLRFALDTLLAGELGSPIEAERIVAGGHSYGANTTLLAAGARVAREGSVLDLADARIRAAIVISAPPFYGEDEPQRILASVAVPSLHVTATDDVIRIPGYYSGADDRVKVFEATGSARKWLAVYEGGSHSMFTDRSTTGGATLNPRVKQATQRLVLAFLRGVFDGDGSALAAWPQQHAPLLARFAAPPAA